MTSQVHLFPSVPSQVAYNLLIYNKKWKKFGDVSNARTNQNIRSQRDNWEICIFGRNHLQYRTFFVKDIHSKSFKVIHLSPEILNLSISVCCRIKLFYGKERIFEVSCSIVFLKCKNIFYD